MDVFACSRSDKVYIMPDSDFNACFENHTDKFEPVNKSLADNEDLLMEQILENINTTPLGKVLKRIALLPDVRREKVLGIRQQLTEGAYDLNEHLDVVMEKVLDELAQ